MPLLTALQYRAEKAKHPVGNQKAKTEEGRRGEVPEPEESQEPISWKRYKVKCERRYFKELMQYTGYDLNEAAEVSGLGIHSLYKYLKRNGIPTKRPRLV